MLIVQRLDESLRANESESGYAFSTDYKVTSDDDLSEYDVLQAEGLPRFGQSHPDFPFSRVSRRSASIWSASQGDRKHWRVAVQWETSSEDGDQSEVHPLLREPDVSWSAVTYSRVVERDVETEKPILNSAGQQMSPLPEGDDSRPALKVVVNVAFFSAAEILEFCNHVNSDHFMGVEPGKAKVSAMGATRVIEQFQGQPVVYWRKEVEIHFNNDGWKVQQLDRGFMERVNGELRRIEKDGEPIPEETLLDGAGRPLADGAEPHWIESSVYHETPFSGMHLGV